VKTVFKVVAWIGVIATLPFIILGIYRIVVLIRDIINPPPPGYFNEGGTGIILLLFLFVLGVITMLLGGLISRPKHFDLASLTIGTLYILIMLVGTIPDWISNWQGPESLAALLVFVLPGAFCIFEGFMLRPMANEPAPKRKP
jgi:hypothetical protein